MCRLCYQAAASQFCSSASRDRFRGSLWYVRNTYSSCLLDGAPQSVLHQLQYAGVSRFASNKRHDRGTEGSRSHLQGAYQVPRQMPCNRAFVRDPLDAGFIDAAFSFLFHKGSPVPMSPEPIIDWRSGCRTIPLQRAQDSYGCAMIADSGLVVREEELEVKKGVSCCSTIEGMYTKALFERGFHLKPRYCFLASSSFLRGAGGVPSGSAFPPLWSLRFSASGVYEKVQTARTRRALPRSGAWT